MRILLTWLFSLIVITLYASVPEVIDEMINKYPTADYKVWYYFDHSKGREYYRSQFYASRKTINVTDINRASSAFLSEWNDTDFLYATGVQFRGPDSLSMTIKGDANMAIDLGHKNISLDWSREVKVKRSWKKPDFRSIVSTFTLISKGLRKNTAKVSYTGFKKGIVFVFHRGQGQGLTQGERTTVYNVSLQDFKKLRQTILDFIGSPVPVTVFDYGYHTMVKSECSPDFYAIQYDPETKVLYYLHATVEDEICVPDDWHIINRLQ